MSVVHRNPPAWAMAPQAVQPPAQSQTPYTFVPPVGVPQYLGASNFPPQGPPAAPFQETKDAPTAFPISVAPVSYAQPGIPNAPHGPLTQTPLISLRKDPAYVKCPSCHRDGVTSLSHVSGANSQLWAIVLCFTSCAFVWVPYTFKGFKDVEHRCSNCGVHVATWDRKKNSTQTYYR